LPSPPPDHVQYLNLADYLVLAGAALDVAPEQLFGVTDLAVADSALHAPAGSFAGIEFYPDLVSKAAVLVIHLAKNHPLPDGAYDGYFSSSSRRRPMKRRDSSWPRCQMLRPKITPSAPASMAMRALSMTSSSPPLSPPLSSTGVRAAERTTALTASCSPTAVA
jgi:hypothetical protein